MLIIRVPSKLLWIYLPWQFLFFHSNLLISNGEFPVAVEICCSASQTVTHNDTDTCVQSQGHKKSVLWSLLIIVWIGKKPFSTWICIRLPSRILGGNGEMRVYLCSFRAGKKRGLCYSKMYMKFWNVHGQLKCSPLYKGLIDSVFLAMELACRISSPCKVCVLHLSGVRSNYTKFWSAERS